MNEALHWILGMALALSAAAAQPDARGGVYEGEDIPELLVVEMFYVTSYQRLTHELEAARGLYLEDLGIAPGSAAERMVVEAVLTAWEARQRRPLLDPDATVEENMEHQRRARAGLAADLARIHARLLVDLERAGYDLAKLEHYLETTIRGGMGVSSSEGELSENTRNASRIFEQDLELALAELGWWAG